MINRATTTGGKAALMLAASALVMTPAIGLAAAEKDAPPAISLSFDKISTFTPASADPRLAAMFAGRAGSIADFKFTPAAAKGRPSQLRVAIRARGAPTPARPVEVAVASPISNLAPAQYDLGMAVGWKRLAVAGDVARSSSPDPVIGTRETRGRRGQLQPQEVYRPGRGWRRAQRQPCRARWAGPTACRSMSAALTISAATSR